MSLETPVIDDRTYEDIVAEIRARIPRYTEEWSDFNDNDPGMVLTQLFAWLSDMLLFRLGSVPELNYVKFLQLLGFELKPAGPARAEITFPIRDGSTEYTVIPMRTQLEAEKDENSDDPSPLIFETDTALNAIDARITSLMIKIGASHSVITASNDEDTEATFYPFGTMAAIENALVFGFNKALPNVKLDLMFWIEPSRSDDGTAWLNCSEPRATSFSSPPIVWEYWDGREWAGLTLLQDDTIAFTGSGHVQLKPPSGTMAAVTITPETKSLYWIRARLVRSIYDTPPAHQILAVRTNTVSATQAETIRNELVGGSDASPDQTFTLKNRPVLAESLKLEIDEGMEPRTWIEAPDLFGCGRDELCYTLDRTTGEIRFGDGKNFGAIPLGKVGKPASNIVAREYRVGGGTRGNVAAMKIKNLLSSIATVDADGLGNLFEAENGSDEETLRDLEERARKELKHRDRAVTAGDFEALAKEAANIGRAKALPMFHPAYPGIEIPGVVSVVVIPNRPTADNDDPASVERRPLPGELTFDAVCKYLDARRLLTTELYVIGPTYRKVQVKGQVIAEDDADLAQVKTDINNELLTYFDPLTGGKDGDGWPFGGMISYSQLLKRIASVDGVSHVPGLSLVVDDDDDDPYPPCADVRLKPHEIVYSESHDDIAVEYETDES